MPDVDHAYIRRAVECSDLAALRIAVYQASGDPEVGELGPVARLDEADRERLVERCTELIERDLDSWSLRVPDDDEIRSMLEMVIGEPTPESEFELRKGVLSFDDFPFFADWPDGVDTAPEGFHVAIIGGGFNGIATAVQLEQLGIPYTVLRAARRARRHVEHQPLPRHPGRHAELLLRVQLREGLRLDGVLRPRPRGAGLPRPHRRHVRRRCRTCASATTSSRPASTTTPASGRSPSAWPTAPPCRRPVNVVVSAAGLFANPLLPDFPGIDAFGGTVIHPTRWPDDIDLSDKRVAVIGNGSTGVQLLGRVAEMSQHVDVFQRTPQWISPRAKYGEPVEPEMRWLIDTMPGYWNWCRITSIMHLFDFHKDYLIRDPEFEATGGRVTRDERERPGDAHPVHPRRDRRPPGPHRPARPRLRADGAPPHRRQRLVPGPHPRQRRPGHRRHRRVHRDRHPHRRRRPPRRRRRGLGHRLRHREVPLARRVLRPGRRQPPRALGRGLADGLRRHARARLPEPLRALRARTPSPSPAASPCRRGTRCGPASSPAASPR